MAEKKQAKKKASGGSKKESPRVYPNVPTAGLTKKDKSGRRSRYCGGGKLKK